MDNPFDIKGHITAGDMQKMGYVAWRELPDGEWLGIVPMTFGKGRLCSGISHSGYEDAWCFPSLESAMLAMYKWGLPGHEEPQGWTRHPLSGRRREGGDPDKEVVFR